MGPTLPATNTNRPTIIIIFSSLPSSERNHFNNNIALHAKQKRIDTTLSSALLSSGGPISNADDLLTMWKIHFVSSVCRGNGEYATNERRRGSGPDESQLGLHGSLSSECEIRAKSNFDAVGCLFLAPFN